MNNDLLQKVEQFTKTAMEEISSLEAKVKAQQEQLSKKAEAKEKFQTELKKAAKALFKSDFLNDEDELHTFMKRAEADPAYLAGVLVKVCRASDVVSFGSVSKARMVKPAEYDPVVAKAFGWNSENSIIDDID